MLAAVRDVRDLDTRSLRLPPGDFRGRAYRRADFARPAVNRRNG